MGKSLIDELSREELIVVFERQVNIYRVARFFTLLEEYLIWLRF